MFDIELDLLDYYITPIKLLFYTMKNHCTLSVPIQTSASGLAILSLSTLSLTIPTITLVAKTHSIENVLLIVEKGYQKHF